MNQKNRLSWPLLCLLAASQAAADQGTVTKWIQAPQHQVGENIDSAVDWRLIMGPDPVPMRVAADDFRSDGRPILTVRWWGSYFDGQHQPQTTDGSLFSPIIEDGFLLSFFSDQPADVPGGPGFSRPDRLLGSYVAPIEKVRISPTDMIGWDQHRIWEFEVNLQDAHLDHPSELATDISFNEQAGDIYWLSIAAENGHRILPDWTSVDTGDPFMSAPWWGWHTSPDAFNDAATHGMLVMPGTEWDYSQWNPIDAQHGAVDLAFELKTVPLPAALPLFMAGLSLSGLLAGTKRRH